MQRSKTTTRPAMPPGTPTPRAHVRTAPGRVSRPSTAPTPTSDSGPTLPGTSPQPSRQPSPAPPATLEAERPAHSPQPAGSSAPPTSNILHSTGATGIIDMSMFLQAYANGEWDPNRIPDPPFELKLPTARTRGTSSPSAANSALSSSSTVAVTLSPAVSVSSDASFPSQGLVGPDRRPRVPHDSRTSSIASRRGTATPDLSSSSAQFNAPTFPYVHAPRKVQRSHSDVEVRSPGGVPPPTLPALPSPSIDRAATAATIRWAGSGVNVAPYALPSPEAAELLDPMRKAMPVLNLPPSVHTKSRLSNFWEESRRDPVPPPPAINPQPASPEATAAQTNPPASAQSSRKAPASASAPRPVNSPGDYFSRSHSHTHSRSRTPAVAEESRDVPSQSSSSSQHLNPSSSLPATTWSTAGSSPLRANMMNVCAPDLFMGSVMALAGSPGPLSQQIDSSAHIANGYPVVPEQLLTSLSSSADGAEFFTPSETLIQPENEIEGTPPIYLIPPAPPDELERRKALYRFNILHTSRDVNFDRITHLCKLVFSTKMVIISLIDKDEQWFKSESGFGVEGSSRDSSFCAHSILQRGAEPLVVLDSHLDWRFANNPMVLGSPHIRFYAGAPLRTTEGYNVGTLCVIDDKPREEFTPRQRHTLKEFAAIVMREMELWRDKIQLQVRDRIQNSMERFTRECLELEEPGPQGANSMEKVYDRALKLVKRALDLEGAVILDIAHLECVEAMHEDGTKSYSYRGDTFTESSHASAQLSASPSIHATGDKSSLAASYDKPFERISTPVVLGSAHSNFKPKQAHSLSGADHERLSTFLTNHPDGKIYEHIAPTYLRDWAIPSNATYSMIVPIFNVDHHPFALLCAYITDPAKHLLEGYELQFLRAIGVIILSAVLKRRMILADKAKSLFISNISHELRTPLHGILAAAELIADTSLTDTQSAFLKTIQSCGASLGETVNHVLDFTKLSGNREHTIPRSKTNLLTLVEDTVEGCWIGARARASSEIGSVYSPPRALPGTNAASKSSGGRHVETIVEIAYRARGWSCICEKAGIRRILMNLIGNSLKFTSDGFVYVGLREVAYNAENKIATVELSVNDTGKGISKDFLTNQLFQPFSQENPLHTGTGLGLAIVNSIVRSEAVDGQVDVWSQEGVGTEIKISFDVEELPPSTADVSLVSGKFEHLDVYMIGFSPHKGEQELRSTISTVLTDWWGVTLVEEADRAEVLLVNEEIQFLSDLVSRQEFSTPVILLTSARGDQRLMSTVKSFERSGGFCRLIFKPGGPSRLFTALQDCRKFRDGDLHPLPGVNALPNSPGTPPADTSTRRSSQHIPSSPRPTSRESLSLQRELELTQLSEPSQRRSEGQECNQDEEQQLSRRLSDFTTVPLADEGSVMLESATGTLNTTRKPRVLVVEDNPINRNLLAHWLRKRGMEYKEATDGVEGVRTFRNAASGHYQVLLVDLSMPNLGGIGCVTQIRAIERERKGTTPCAKIFALTGLATPEDKRRALAAGFDGYLIKPVSFKTLDGLFQKLASG